MLRHRIFSCYSHEEGTGSVIDFSILYPGRLSLSSVVANFHGVLIVSASRLLSLCTLESYVHVMVLCAACAHLGILYWLCHLSVTCFLGYVHHRWFCTADILTALDYQAHQQSTLRYLPYKNLIFFISMHVLVWCTSRMHCVGRVCYAGCSAA